LNTKPLAAMLLGVFCLGMPVLACSQKPKADKWALNNAQIGPDSPIEVAAGTTYAAQVMYPVPDGPLFPLKAGVAWSIAPAVKGISIEPQSGKITVAATVAHGTTTTIHANVAEGRRKLQAALHVFRPDENPLIGTWKIDARIACGEANALKVASHPEAIPGPTWRFHVKPDFFVGREYGIAAGVRLAGIYELDVKAAKLKLITQWPKNKPETNWTLTFADAGKTLYLRPVETNEKLEAGCSYVLRRL
jgi:hypothetical protein